MSDADNQDIGQGIGPTHAARGDTSPKISLAFLREFCLCFLSFEFLMLGNLFGTLAIVGFMLPWVWLVIRRPLGVKAVLIENWPLLLLPILALVTVPWSIERGWTVRAALELGLTMSIAIMAATCIRPRALIAALLVVFMTIAVMSIASGNLAAVGNSGEEAMTGIFASKNAFAGMMSLLLLLSVCVFLDRGYGPVLRGTAFLGVLITPVLVYMGHSLGSTASVAMTLLMYAGLRFLAFLPASLRLLAMVAGIAMLVVLFMLVVVFDINPLQMLTLVGKDATLTGRTHLWDEGLKYFSERPLFGVGYRSFWRVDNPRAVGLWIDEGVPIGAGFNFHNEYLSMMVEDGLAGLVLLLGYVFVTCGRAFHAGLGKPRAEQVLAVMLAIYLILRSPLEVSFFSPFSIVTIFVCMTWVYLKPSHQVSK